jgi:hypothetical protein
LSINLLNNEELTNAFDDTLIALFGTGFNAATKVYVFDKNTYWQVTRNTAHSVTLLINKDKGYNITIIQDGSMAQMETSDSTTNNIFIKQTK